MNKKHFTRSFVLLVILAALALIALTGCLAMPGQANPAPTQPFQQPMPVQPQPDPVPQVPQDQQPQPVPGQAPQGQQTPLVPGQAPQDQQPLIPPPPGEPQITFTSDRMEINAGECATLQWSVQGGSAVQLNGQSVNPYSQQQVCPASTTHYALNVDWGISAKKQKELIILVGGASQQQSNNNNTNSSSSNNSGCPGAPIFASDPTANPSTITLGQSTTLSWGNVTNGNGSILAQSLTVTGLGEVGSGGSSRVVTPSTAGTVTYTFTATGCGGTTTKTVSVTISNSGSSSSSNSGCPGAPVFASGPTANPSTLAKGQSTTLSWGNVTNGNSTVLVKSLTVTGLGEVGSGASSRVVIPGTAGTVTYTFTATGCGGTTTKTVSVTVSNLPTYKVVSLDLALDDLYTDSSGKAWARIKNNGPDEASNISTNLTCNGQQIVVGSTLPHGVSGGGPISINLKSGQTQDYYIGISRNPTMTYLMVTCKLDWSGTLLGDNPGNNSKTKQLK